MPISWVMRRSRLRRREVPPAITIPRSTTSEASSGGVRSRTERMAPTIDWRESEMPCVMSVEVTVMVRGANLGPNFAGALAVDVSVDRKHPDDQHRLWRGVAILLEAAAKI